MHEEIKNPRPVTLRLTWARGEKSGVAPNMGSGVEWTESLLAYGVLPLPPTPPAVRAMARIPFPMTDSTRDRLPDRRRVCCLDFFVRRLLGP